MGREPEHAQKENSSHEPTCQLEHGKILNCDIKRIILGTECNSKHPVICRIRIHVSPSHHLQSVNGFISVKLYGGKKEVTFLVKKVMCFLPF